MPKIPNQEQLFEILKRDGREDLIEEIKKQARKKAPERRLVLPASQQYTAPRSRSKRNQNTNGDTK